MISGPFFSFLFRKDNTDRAVAQKILVITRFWIIEERLFFMWQGTAHPVFVSAEQPSASWASDPCAKD